MGKFSAKSKQMRKGSIKPKDIDPHDGAVLYPRRYLIDSATVYAAEG